MTCWQATARAVLVASLQFSKRLNVLKSGFGREAVRVEPFEARRARGEATSDHAHR
jgi:hypothetical protein